MIDIHYQKSEKKPETVQTQLDQAFDILFEEVMKDGDKEWKTQIDDYGQLGISLKYGVTNTERSSETITRPPQNG
jgi:hypothetical protein